MDEYIERESIYKILSMENPFGWNNNDLAELFREAKPADVAPVIHGRWETNSDRPDSLICSVCKCGFDMWKHDPHNYCPNCGAKMDEKED